MSIGKPLLSLLLIITLLFGMNKVYADSYADLLAKADYYLENEEYSKALACCDIAQKVEPHNIEAYNRAFFICQRTGDRESELDVIDSALEVFPTSSDLWSRRCEIDCNNMDIASYEKDAIYAEICGADLAYLSLPAAKMYMQNNDLQKAYIMFSACAIEDFEFEDKVQYIELLGRLGNYDERNQLVNDLLSTESELDPLFNSDSLLLYPIEFPAITNIVINTSDECISYLRSKENAYVTNLLNDSSSISHLSWLSVSPQERSGLLTDGTLLYSYYNGTIHPLYPSYSKGVTDELHFLAKYCEQPLEKQIGRAGVVYSNDGHYAALVATGFPDVAMDPMMIDLQTGELILTGTANKKVARDFASSVTGLMFSSDNRYLYYIADIAGFVYSSTFRELKNEYGENLWEANMETDEGKKIKKIILDSLENNQGGFPWLMKYDISAQKTEICTYLGYGFVNREYSSHYYSSPHLMKTKLGDFVSMTLCRERELPNRSNALVLMHRMNDDWTTRTSSFDLSCDVWEKNILLYNADSDYAIVPGGLHTEKERLSSKNSYSAFQLIQPELSFKGINRYLVISKEKNTVESLNAEKITQSVQSYEEGKSEWPFLDILSLHISPDGQYALLLTYNAESSAKAIYLLKLSTLEMKEIAGIDPNMIDADGGYSGIVEWNSNRMIIKTTKGFEGFTFFK